MHHIKTYTITLIPQQGGYTAVCLGLDECRASAPTRENALEAIEDVIKARIADATVRRIPIPIDLTSTKFLWVNTEEFLV